MTLFLRHLTVCCDVLNYAVKSMKSMNAPPSTCLVTCPPPLPPLSPLAVLPPPLARRGPRLPRPLNGLPPCPPLVLVCPVASTSSTPALGLALAPVLPLPPRSSTNSNPDRARCVELTGAPAVRAPRFRRRLTSGACICSTGLISGLSTGSRPRTRCQ